MHPTFRLLSAAALLALAGCASNTASRVGDAATTPLSDLNIKKTDIPAVLVSARKNPYQMPAPQNCVAIALEIRELDEALGADLDAPVLDAKPSLMHKASDVATDQAVNAVQRTAQDLIPFRGWVRKLSGAERYSSHVSACIMAGSVRRAFLKGVAASQGCAWREVPASVDKT